jgi:hypothetical protein
MACGAVECGEQAHPIIGRVVVRAAGVARGGRVGAARLGAEETRERDRFAGIEVEVGMRAGARPQSGPDVVRVARNAGFEWWRDRSRRRRQPCVTTAARERANERITLQRSLPGERGITRRQGNRITRPVCGTAIRTTGYGMQRDQDETRRAMHAESMQIRIPVFVLPHTNAGKMRGPARAGKRSWMASFVHNSPTWPIRSPACFPA